MSHLTLSTAAPGTSAQFDFYRVIILIVEGHSATFSRGFVELPNPIIKACVVHRGRDNTCIDRRPASTKGSASRCPPKCHFGGQELEIALRLLHVLEVLARGYDKKVFD